MALKQRNAVELWFQGEGPKLLIYKTAVKQKKKESVPDVKRTEEVKRIIPEKEGDK